MAFRVPTLAVALPLVWANTVGAVADYSEVSLFPTYASSDYSYSCNDFARVYTPVNPRVDACSQFWWSFPMFSFMPGSPYSQQCSTAYPSLSFFGLGNECIESREAVFNPSIGGSWSSWTGPLTLNLTPLRADDSAQTETPAEPGQVEPRLTPISGSLAARELKRAWKRLLHETPSDDVALIITAHWAHETHGGRQMYNYNFGGIKGHAPDGCSCLHDAHEGSGFHVKAIRDRFRAYQSVRSGAEDYLSLLVRKYPEAIAAAQRGDVTDFVAALKSRRYFTGSESDYARSLSELVKQAAEFGFDVLSTDRN